tara:strand:- start:317 stop:1000 length:684 start_codon:yes stop_codon:yes gene_type:complete
MDIIIPESWDDVTVNQYQALKELNKDDYNSDLGYANVVLQILCDIPTADPFTLDVVAKIMPYLNFVNTPPPTKKLKSFVYKDDSYNWIGDFGAITLGEAVSIEQIIDLEELTFDQSLDVVLAVLLRKNEEAFTAEGFTKNRISFGSLPISKVNGMLLFFLNGGKSSINNMKDCLIMTATTKKIILKRSYKYKMQSIILRKVRQLINGYQLLTSFLRATLQTILKRMK